MKDPYDIASVFDPNDSHLTDGDIRSEYDPGYHQPITRGDIIWNRICICLASVSFIGYILIIVFGS